MRRIAIVSPYRGKRAVLRANVAYLHRCIKDVLTKGDAPYAAHAYLPLVLDDTNAEEREQGIQAGQAWLEQAELIAVYVDRGVSPGMQKDLAFARSKNIPIEIRSLSV